MEEETGDITDEEITKSNLETQKIIEIKDINDVSGLLEELKIKEEDLKQELPHIYGGKNSTGNFKEIVKQRIEICNEIIKRHGKMIKK